MLNSSLLNIGSFLYRKELIHINIFSWAGKYVIFTYVQIFFFQLLMINIKFCIFHYLGVHQPKWRCLRDVANFRATGKAIVLCIWFFLNSFPTQHSPAHSLTHPSIYSSSSHPEVLYRSLAKSGSQVGHQDYDNLFPKIINEAPVHVGREEPLTPTVDHRAREPYHHWNVFYYY